MITAESLSVSVSFRVTHRPGSKYLGSSWTYVDFPVRKAILSAGPKLYPLMSPPFAGSVGL